MIEQGVTTMSTVPNEFDPAPSLISTDEGGDVSDLFLPDKDKLIKFVRKQ